MTPVAESSFDMQRVPRPILARDADATYWMSRYVERIENVSRMLLVSTETLLDLKDIDPAVLDRQWRSVLRVMHAEEPASDSPPAEDSLGALIARHMTFCEDNSTSLVCSLTRARENARGIREGISNDMWEHLNGLYWSLRSDQAAAQFTETPTQFFQNLVTGAMTFHGLTDQTLPHDQRWHFAQLGKHFERITFTCRMLQEKMDVIFSLPEDSPMRNVRRVATLRSCNSLEVYRRAYPGELDAELVTGFLLFEPAFPRSIRHCVASAREAAAAIRSEVRPRSTDPAERVLGKLQAQLDYANSSEVLNEHLAAFLEQIRQQTHQASVEIQNSYFLH